MAIDPAGSKISHHESGEINKVPKGCCQVAKPGYNLRSLGKLHGLIGGRWNAGDVRMVPIQPAAFF